MDSTEREQMITVLDRGLLSPADFVDRVVIPLLVDAKREALRDAATEWSEGAWADQWLVDRVDDDVSAVQSTERWLLARAEQVQT